MRRINEVADELGAEGDLKPGGCRCRGARALQAPLMGPQRAHRDTGGCLPQPSPPVCVEERKLKPGMRTLGPCSAIAKGDTLPLATPGMDLEGITRSETSRVRARVGYETGPTNELGTQTSSQYRLGGGGKEDGVKGSHDDTRRTEH